MLRKLKWQKRPVFLGLLKVAQEVLVKIAMIGSSMVGQTSFLASLYNQMSRSSVRGFKLHGTRNTDVMLSKIWKNIITQKQMPEPSTQNDIYSFDLMYDDQILERVDIYSNSFPTQHLSESGKNKDGYIQADVDGLFIFLDANNILSNKHNDSYASLSELLHDFLTENGTNKVYTAIVITKCDVFKKEQLKTINDFKELISKNILNFSALHPLFFDVFLVSSIGEKSTDLPASISYKLPSSVSMHFNLDTTNVANPILFFLEWFINNNLQKDERRLSNYVDELAKLIDSYSIKDELVNLMLNRPKINDQIVKKVHQLTELRNSVNNQKMISRAFQQEIK